MCYVDAGALQQVKPVGKAVYLIEYYTLNASLDDELRALHTRRGCDVEGRAGARIVRSGHLGYRIGFSVKHIRLCRSTVVLAHVLKPRGCAIEAVRYYHLPLYEESSHLTALTVRVFSPYTGHPQVAAVEEFLLIVKVHRMCEVRLTFYAAKIRALPLIAKKIAWLIVMQKLFYRNSNFPDYLPIFAKYKNLEL